MDYKTPADIAKKLGKTARQVQRYCHAGLLPGAIQVGRSWGIPLSALVGFNPPPPGNPNMGPDFWRKRRRKKKAS